MRWRGFPTIATFVVVANLTILCAAQKKVSEVSPKTRQVVSAYNEFGFRVFKQLAAPAAQNNVFIAPSSIAIALTIAYNGAVGETKKAMAKAMGLEDISDEVVNNANLELRQLFGKIDPKTELLVANALWLRKGVEFREEFLTLSRKFFDAEINPLTTAKAINDWVAQKTKGKINRIVDRVEPFWVWVIANAVYFKGLWQKKFDKRLTKPEDFHLPTGEKIKVPMMSQSGKFSYLRGEGFQAVCLPYGETGRLKFYLFVPDKGKSLAGFLQMLNQQNWERWIASFRMMDGDVKMPRFKIEYGAVSLKKPLTALGMGIAFNLRRADFSKASPIEPNLYIENVLHKAVVEVNEEGTEAAGVTAIIGVPGAVAPRERFTLVADRPFFFAICDSLTGFVLFAGIVNKP